MTHIPRSVSVNFVSVSTFSMSQLVNLVFGLYIQISIVILIIQ